MTGRLAAYVHVAGKVYRPGDVPPPDVAARITNPAAWDAATETASGDELEEHAVPPRSGPGSGVKAWVAYAAARDVSVPDGAGRDDVVALLDAAGVSTQQKD